MRAENKTLVKSHVWRVKVSVTQSCLTFWDPMDCSLPCSSVHGILQARILEWVAIPFSKGPSQPRDQTQVSFIAHRFFAVWATREQTANIRWIIKKAREFQKNIYFCFTDYAKALTVWITTNCGKFLKKWEYQTTLPVSWETCMQVKKQQKAKRN